MDLREVGKELAVQSAVQYGFLVSGIYDRVFNPFDNIVVGSLKKGGLMYLNNEVSNLFLAKPSNLVEMNGTRALDDILYFAEFSAVTDITDIGEGARSVLPAGVLGDVVHSSAMLLGAEYLGSIIDGMSDNVALLKNVRHPTRLVSYS